MRGVGEGVEGKVKQEKERKKKRGAERCPPARSRAASAASGDLTATPQPTAACGKDGGTGRRNHGTHLKKSSLQ